MNTETDLTVEELKAKNLALEKENAILQAEVNYWKHKLFGRKTEKFSPEEYYNSTLFNEAEMHGEPPEEKAEEKISIPAHTKSRPHRRPLPFYRLSNIMQRMGVQLSRQTMCSWAIKIAEKLIDYMALLKEELLAGSLIGADETTVQVIKEPDREAKTKSYMWLFRGGRPGKQVRYYQYREHRSGKFLPEYLAGFEGYLQCDAYAARAQGEIKPFSNYFNICDNSK